MISKVTDENNKISNKWKLNIINHTWLHNNVKPGISVY